MFDLIPDIFDVSLKSFNFQKSIVILIPIIWKDLILDGIPADSTPNTSALSLKIKDMRLYLKMMRLDTILSLRRET